ncbi:MAG: OmpA family protein [Flavobacteriales bacterium]|nr:OmpA family protein [Flavobacteriales bacterium]
MVLKHHFLLYVLVVFTLFSCVPAKKYEELKAKQQACNEELAALKARSQELEEKNQGFTASEEQLKKQITQLQNDAEAQRMAMEQTSADYEAMKKKHQLLMDEIKNDKDKSATAKLMKQLQKAQEDLQNQEDALRALESSLLKKEETLKKLQADLEAREKRVKELEALINAKDEKLAAIKKKLKEALLGFENNGLTIEQKNGKVYVSLDESLLFASGSYTVGERGTDALKKLAKVLESTTDINVVVEGHTDNVPLKSKGDIEDNWDLSVKRSTSVVKIITKNSKTDPKRLTAAGRSEYLPIDTSNSVEGRQKNRRIEVILTPKLDELYELLGE